MIACVYFNRDGTFGERFFLPASAVEPDDEPEDDTEETAALLDGLDELLKNWE